MSRVKNLKTTFKNISPYVKPYKVGFYSIYIMYNRSCNYKCNSPKNRRLIITQLTNDVIEIGKRSKGSFSKL